MRRKIYFLAQNGVRQFMRAGRPYCLSHGGNVAAGRHAKTPNVNGGTPSRPASWLNGLLSAVSVAKIKRVGMSSPMLELASREGYWERTVLPANNSISDGESYCYSASDAKKP
ncbi:hypothetical protein WCU79_05460 [Pectobacterium versatile]|uniref:Uncharacterized protein n=1 Tax=Pectobacterium versatile TaxID=2488639 RepID=A0ABU8JY43_9GAMM